MGWIILLVLIALVFGLLVFLGKLPRGAFELTGAALLLGVAGYAWQGQPGMAGVSLEPIEKANSFTAYTINARNDVGEGFGCAGEMVCLFGCSEPFWQTWLGGKLLAQWCEKTSQ